MSTELEKFELPPLDSCHLRTHQMMISETDLKALTGGNEQEYLEARLRAHGFRPNLPYESRGSIDYGFNGRGIVWEFRQQFLVFPNGDEYLKVATAKKSKETE